MRQKIVVGKILGLSLLIIALHISALAQQRIYVGAERCRSCHEKAYETWVRSGHAKAQTNLPGDKEEDLGCLFCHATDVQRKLQKFQFSNVQCEACHGAGSEHIRLAAQNVSGKARPGGLIPASEKQCRQCHADVRSATLRPFQYDTARRLIQHW